MLNYIYFKTCAFDKGSKFVRRKTSLIGWWWHAPHF